MQVKVMPDGRVTINADVEEAAALAGTEAFDPDDARDELHDGLLAAISKAKRDDTLTGPCARTSVKPRRRRLPCWRAHRGHDDGGAVV